MHHFVQASNELLRKRGYRLTPQRYMILSVIQEANEHLSVEQITERVQARNPYVSLSTIYRTLELLKKLNLIHENHLGEQTHYEAADGLAHHHLVCRKCHATIHLDEALLGDLHRELEAKYHYHGLTLNLDAAGYCASCWRALQKEGEMLEAQEEVQDLVEPSEYLPQAPEAHYQQGQSQQVDK
ncbi:MAG: transcriptional repressor [Ktedonobacteraceae bacterium]|nr:transcriptional repressor [Ktedonobacteraceae bacterium]